jgi:branched-chain amino acid transport system ATP-binding protein
MLAIARALMSRPRLVMFDEPSLGLAPSLVEQVFAIVQDIRATGTTVLMVEQNAMAALQLCDRAYLLETGHVLRTGTGAELLASPDVRDAYLGGGI